MPGNKAGGQKYRETMIKRYGSEEAWKEVMRGIGSVGGKNGTTGGFAANRQLAREAGRKSAASRKGIR